MADTKITALTALTAADPINDVIPIVDVSDTSMAASGTTKKISVNNILSSSPTASGALTVTGLVTAGSATITGAATVGTTLGVTGVSTLTGNVGVGVTPTNVAGHTRVEIKGSGSGNLTLRTASGNAAARDWQVACNLDTFGELNFRQGASTGAEPNSGTTRMVLTAAGDVSVSTGNVVMATSGKGIDFSAVTGGTGTATANVLNDYEEGTFTATVLGSTVAGVGVYTVNNGFYTKVGNLVTVQVYLIWTALTGGTGDLRFGGLPFAASGETNALSSASVGYVDNITLTASNILTVFNSASNTFLQAYQYPVGGGAASIVPVDLAGGIFYTITYRV